MKVLWNKGEFYTQVYEKPFCTQEPRGFSHREVQRNQLSLLSYIYSMKEKRNGNAEQNHWSGTLNKFNYLLDL